MKSGGAIHHKLKQVQFRHLKRLLDTELRPAPCNCKFNGAFRHPNSPEPVGVCLYGAQEASTWGGVVCDEKWGGVEQAKECPYFTACRDRDDIKAEFKAFLKSDIAEIAVVYPDVAALQWVLGEDVAFDDDWDNEG